MKPTKSIPVYFKQALLILYFFSISSFGQTTAEDEEYVLGMYDKFQTTVKAKNITEHRKLLLHNSMPVNIIRKSTTGPTISAIDAETWIAFFSQPQPYELRISEINLKLEENIGISIAFFREYVNNSFSAYGTDVFSYVKTDDGWKYSTFNNTVVNSRDNNDYSIPYDFHNSPEDIPVEVSEAISQKDKSDFLGQFTSGAAHFITVDSVFNESFSSMKHTANAFIDYLLASSGNISYELSNYEISVYDQYAGSIIGDYTLSEDGNISETGRVIYVLNASREAGWRVSVAMHSKNPNVTGLEDKARNIPGDYELKQNYPNPFNPSTTINYRIPKSGYVQLNVYNMLGEKITSLINGYMPAGNHSTNFNAANLSSGIYIYTLKSNGVTATNKMTILK